jgi:hypothetical protein
MAKSVIKVPSLQHVARSWRDNPDAVRRKLVATTKRPPTFSCDPLNVATRDMMVLRVSHEQAIEYIRRAEKRPAYQRILLEVLPLLRCHLDSIDPDFFQGVARRCYPVAPDIKIPFQPPLIYGIGGQLYFPWFSWWRANPLTGRSLSLFVTMVDEMLLQDPDLENAAFEILDFSIPKGEKERALTIADTRSIPRLSAAERNDMLAIWAEGSRRARIEMAGAERAKESREEDDLRPDDGQSDLFGNDRRTGA